MCSRAAPSVTSLLNLLYITSQLVDFLSVSWIYITLNQLPKYKHIQEKDLSCVQKLSTLPGKASVKTLCVHVTMQATSSVLQTSLNITPFDSTVGIFIAVVSMPVSQNHALHHCGPASFILFIINYVQSTCA